jgi:hypothetical protein
LWIGKYKEALIRRINVGQLDRTFPTDGKSPCDFYAYGAPDRALGHFQWSLTGSSAPDGDAVVFIDVDDATTISSGDIHGLKIDYASTGTKTGGNIHPFTVEATVSGFIDFMYAVGVWTETSGNPTIDQYTSFYCYMGDGGTGVNEAQCLHLAYDHDNAATASRFIRMRNHGSTTMTTALRLEGSNPCTYLLDLQQESLPFQGTVLSGSIAARIRVRAGGNDYYLPLYTS